MNREETHALVAQGKAAWNAWAESMLAERTALIAHGQWVESPYRKSSVAPKSEAARDWMRKVRAEFSSLEAPYTFANEFIFDGWTFPGDADFTGATFVPIARFDGAIFSGHAEFAHATFSTHARFGEAMFVGDAGFEDARFAGDARFGEATFKGKASFNDANFSGDARFSETTFGGDAIFDKTVFQSDARFGEAAFLKDASFTYAHFKGNARFHGVRFQNSVWFDHATYEAQAGYGQCTFQGYASFVDATFNSAADFSAIHADRAFNLAKATFRKLPDFIQAHFAEAPRLDNLSFEQRQSWTSALQAGGPAKTLGRNRGEEGAPARWRALRRLAIQGHDHEREMDFFAGEIKSARFVTDHPLAWPPWRLGAWSGVFRFASGLAFQLLSDFGRSLARPVLGWLLLVALSAMYFLGQNPDVAKARSEAIKAGASRGVITYASGAWSAWRANQPCYAGMTDKNDKGELMVTGLSAPVRRNTSAAMEAMQLALRNAFVFLDNGSDAAHRTFGCLYGVERFGDNFVAIVPSDVTFVSTLQRAFSGVMIFLFGLGLRNMLRVL